MQLSYPCISVSYPTSRLSSILLPRAERELASQRAHVSSVAAERDSLREDLGAVREAKRRAEQSLKAQTERAAALDKELGFYQQQSARVMADRDRAVWEGEELKAANVKVGAGKVGPSTVEHRPCCAWASKSDAE